MKCSVDLLLVALSALLIQIVLAKPVANPQQVAQAAPDVLNTRPEQELEDLKTLTGGVEQSPVGTKPAVAALKVPLTPPKVAAPISDDRIFQGAKQALKTAAAQAQQQPQQQQQQRANTPYINQQDAVESYSDLDMNLDLTPKAVAEYLLITGDFQGFDSAIADLLTANIIKEDEAREYKDAVGWEYEALLKKLVDAKQEYLKEVLANMEPLTSATAAPAAPAAPATEQKRTASDTAQQAVLTQPSLPAEGAADVNAVDLSMALKKLQLKSLLEKEATLDELLQAIVEEYLLRGVESENAPGTAPKASVKINPEEEQLEQMMELMAEAVRQGTQSNLPQQETSKPSLDAAEEELSQVAAAQTNTQERPKPEAQPVGN